VSGTAALPALRGHEHWVRSVAFSPDGTWVVSGSRSSVYGMQSQVLNSKFYEGTSVGFCQSHFPLTALGLQTRPSGSGIQNTEILPVLQGHEHWVPFSSAGTRIEFVSASIDQTIHVWGTDSGSSALPSFRGHKDWVWSVAFSPDGVKIVSGSDGHLGVWEAASGLEVQILALRGHENLVYSLQTELR
jgi:WD40 repeat protein